MKATAIAPSNIALVKYWGRRNNELVLPFNTNLSMTFDKMYTTTTIEFSDAHERDVVIINGKEVDGDKFARSSKHIDLIRKMAGIETRMKMVSTNNFPTRAGFASSASGGAAEAMAAAAAAGLKLNDRELSILARRSGSGSAARSIHGGFVIWHRGERDDGNDSYAEQFVDENYWKEFRVLATVLDEREKKVTSAEGMEDTVKTCPYYPTWVETAKKDVETIRKAILDRDFKAVGETAEHNCLKMHALMLTTRPSLIYWGPETIEIMKAVQAWRSEGVHAYFTIDAGPNVKVLCLKDNQEDVAARLRALPIVKNVIETQPGPGARLVDEHLF